MHRESLEGPRCSLHHTKCPLAAPAVLADELRPHSLGDAAVDSCPPDPALSICMAAEELRDGYNHQ